MVATGESTGMNGRTEPRMKSDVIYARSPRTGAVIGQVRIATPLGIQDAMAQAKLAAPAWAGIGLERRLLFIRALRDALYRQQDRVIGTLTAEQGKIPHEARIEYLAIIEQITFFLNHAQDILAPQEVSTRLVPQREFWLERVPYGTVLVIAPWNYPLFLSLGPVVGALIAGNTVVYKPSEFATQVGEVIGGLMAEAGIPPEVFHVVQGYGDVGAALIQARPDKIVFTGSVPTGRKIAAAAAEHLIPVTLELGGKDAAVVLGDADLKRAAEGIIWSGMFNAGQTCASVERVIVERPVAERLVKLMKQAVERHLALADGRPGELFPALSTPGQIQIVENQVEEAIAQGARAVTGGARIPGTGLFFAPTILTDVTPEMRIFTEETFGPMVAVAVVEDEAEAIRLANESAFGLTASVWTRSRARGVRVARQLHAGNVSINEHLLISGIPEMPWGGIKASGYGRSQGPAGLLEMTYSKAYNADRFRMPFEPFWYPYTPVKRWLLRRAVDALYSPTLLDRLRALLP